MKLLSWIPAVFAGLTLLACFSCGEQSGEDLRAEIEKGGKFNQEESLKALESDSEYKRQVAAEFCAKLGDKKVIKPLINHMHNDPSIMVRKICVSHLAQREGDEVKELVPEFIKVLEQKDSSLREKAVIALGTVRTEEGYSALLGVLQDPVAEVRVEAINSLSLFQKKETLPEIAKLYEDKEYSVRRAAVETIAKLGGKGAADLLTEALKNEDFVVKRTAVEELGKHKARKAGPEIIPLLTADNASLREVAARALGQMRLREAVPDLIKRIKEEKNLDARKAVVEALGMIGGLEQVDPMIELLDDGDQDVRKLALDALMDLEIDSDALKEKLRQMTIHEPNTFLRQDAQKLYDKMNK